MIDVFGPLDADVEGTIRIILDSDPKNGETYDAVLDWASKHVTSEATRSTREARQRYISHIVVSELFPHMGLNADAGRKKCIFLAHMARRLVRVGLGKEPVDDRDDLENKRVDSAGALMALLVRQHCRSNLMRKLNAYLRKVVEKGDAFKAGDAVSHKSITSGLRYAFATGTWGIQR
ncbi:MAG: hypothetical protein GY871_11280 [Actinomycetales bacterium]|nr:hypothetical protein [Actinomycetales bacterium]